MPSFAQELQSALPAGLTLDGPLVALLDWCEAEGRVYTYRRRNDRFASPYALNPFEPGHPAMVFGSTPDYARYWLGQDDPDLTSRLAPILRTGGDGSQICLWRDESGAQHYVHAGSGSGSTMVGTLTQDVGDIIALLAIGYDELCWPEVYQMTPAAYAATQGTTLIPRQDALIAWLARTLGRVVPAQASDLVAPPGDMAGPPGDDPFLLWLADL